LSKHRPLMSFGLLPGLLLAAAGCGSAPALPIKVTEGLLAERHFGDGRNHYLTRRVVLNKDEESESEQVLFFLRGYGATGAVLLQPGVDTPSRAGGDWPSAEQCAPLGPGQVTVKPWQGGLQVIVEDSAGFHDQALLLQWVSEDGRVVFEDLFSTGDLGFRTQDHLAPQTLMANLAELEQRKNAPPDGL